MAAWFLPFSSQHSPILSQVVFFFFFSIPFGFYFLFYFLCGSILFPIPRFISLFLVLGLMHFFNLKSWNICVFSHLLGWLITLSHHSIILFLLDFACLFLVSSKPWFNFRFGSSGKYSHLELNSIVGFACDFWFWKNLCLLVISHGQKLGIVMLSLLDR